ncbi:unnamed protein product [Closterium sp. NIES-64]|nr:unnamed protein product [Closterium sp. NIES-64]
MTSRAALAAPAYATAVGVACVSVINNSTKVAHICTNKAARRVYEASRKRTVTSLAPFRLVREERRGSTRLIAAAAADGPAASADVTEADVSEADAAAVEAAAWEILDDFNRRDVRGEPQVSLATPEGISAHKASMLLSSLLVNHTPPLPFYTYSRSSPFSPTPYPGGIAALKASLLLAAKAALRDETARPLLGICCGSVEEGFAALRQYLLALGCADPVSAGTVEEGFASLRQYLLALGWLC